MLLFITDNNFSITVTFLLTSKKIKNSKSNSAFSFLSLDKTIILSQLFYFDYIFFLIETLGVLKIIKMYQIYPYVLTMHNNWTSYSAQSISFAYFSVNIAHLMFQFSTKRYLKCAIITVCLAYLYTTITI